MLTALQAENARSMKLLRIYLDQSKGEQCTEQTTPFNFVFFKKQKSRTDEHTKGKAIGDGFRVLRSAFVCLSQEEQTCEKISMALPPPVTVPCDSPLPSATLTALKKLLTAMGVSPDLIRNVVAYKRDRVDGHT